MRHTTSSSIPALLLFVSLLPACGSAPVSTNPDLQHLQGYWEGLGPGGPCSVTISGDSLFYAQPKKSESSREFWYDTTFTLPDATGPKQLHATILANSDEAHVGTVIVTIFKIEGEKLTLGVVEDHKGPPPSSIVGDWEWVRDLYDLERADPPAGGLPKRPG